MMEDFRLSSIAAIFSCTPAMYSAFSSARCRLHARRAGSAARPPRARRVSWDVGTYHY
jgi:hypothetical protein